MQSKRTSGGSPHSNSTSPKSDCVDLDLLTPTQLYWRQKLTNLNIPELPAWQPIGEQISAKQIRSFIVSSAEIAALQTSMQQAHPEMILLASFYALIFRHTNEGNFALHVVDQKHGPLPTLVNFDHQTQFIDLVEIINNTYHEARKNSASLSDICHAIPDESRVLLQATTNIFVALQHNIQHDNTFKHDYLDVSFNHDTHHNWEICFSYNPSFFSELQIDTMLTHLKNILGHAKDAGICLIGEIPILTRSEIDAIEEYNSTDYALRFDEKFVHEVLIDIANESPDLPCQVYHPPGDAAAEVMTYRTFNLRTNQIANYLREKCNIKHGDIVVVNVPRSLNLATYWFGIMKAGAVWMALDSTHDSKEELDRKIKQSGAVFVIGTRDTLPTVQSNQYRTLAIDDAVTEAAIDATDNSYHRVGIQANSPAYISHTSGSTGTAKAAENSHAGLRNLLTATHQMNYKEQSRVFTFSLAIHDPFINDFMVALATRGCIHFLSSIERTSPLAINNVIRNNALTFAALPPEIMSLIPAGSSLQEVHIMGASPYLGRLLEWKQANTALRLFLGYGPTEGTVMSTLHLYEIGDDIYIIGKPVANTKVYVLNPKTYAHCGRGMMGEIFIGGDCVNYNQYSNNPEKTEEKFRWIKYDKSLQKFTPAEHHELGAIRVYAAGDNASYEIDRDGKYVVKYHGRTDDNVKIFNIFVNLAHIAAQILEHPDIEKAVVRLYKDPAGQESDRLIAYVVPKKTKKYSQSAIDQVLLAHLIDLERKSKSEKKTPYPQFELLKVLPISPNGKINLKKLPKPRDKPPVVINEDEDLLSKLTAVWKSLSLDPEHTFENAGGKSRIMAELEMILNDENGHFRPNPPIGFGEGGLSADMTVASLAKILEPRLQPKTLVLPPPQHDPRLLHHHAPMRGNDQATIESSTYKAN